MWPLIYAFRVPHETLTADQSLHLALSVPVISYCRPAWAVSGESPCRSFYMIVNSAHAKVNFKLLASHQLLAVQMERDRATEAVQGARADFDAIRQQCDALKAVADPRRAERKQLREMANTLQVWPVMPWCGRRLDYVPAAGDLHLLRKDQKDMNRSKWI